MDIRVSENLKKLPPYLFVEIDQAKRKARAEGRDIIDLGIGDPDIPTPEHIIKAMQEAVADPANHRYALDAGLPQLREEITAWYQRRFSVELNPDNEILPLIGSKEGIAHIPVAFLNPGDIVLASEPGYPPYRTATLLAGGEPYLMSLKEENSYLPDLKSIPAEIIKKAKLMFINYPNNPTSALAGNNFYEELIEFANKNNIIVCADAAYSEIYFDGNKPRSFLEFKGAKEVGVEFHSLSKTYNMTGWRIGWVAGNKDVVAALGKVKSNIDSGIFQAVQVAGIAALKTEQKILGALLKTYQERRDVLCAGLKELGWDFSIPQATFYVWIKVPKGTASAAFAKRILEAADCVVTPGNGFGPSGEGYIRIALTVGKERIKEALERLKKL